MKSYLLVFDMRVMLCMVEEMDDIFVMSQYYIIDLYINDDWL